MPRRSKHHRALLALVLAVLAVPIAWSAHAGGSPAQGDSPPPAAAAALLYPRTIVIVRHAEKLSDDPRDPALSEAGIRRARALDRLLAGAGVTHLFATPFKRTQQTLLPIAMRTGLETATVPPADPAALLSGLRNLPRHSVAVVAGHSNTVPKLVAELAKGSAHVREHPDGPPMGEQDYDRLYVITQWAERGSSVVELRYGD